MEVFSGYLTVKTPSRLKTKTYTNSWCVLFSGCSTESPRIDLHGQKDSVHHSTCKTTIYLIEAKWKKIDIVNVAFSLEIKQGKQYLFICPSESELKSWINFLCCLSRDLLDSKNLLRGENNLTMTQNRIAEDSYVTEENVLYSSAGDVFTFDVIADNTEGCHYLGLKGLYKLRIIDTTVQLLNYGSLREVTSWSLCELRNFGHSVRTCFINAGSRSKTGEGKFIFHTSEGKKIVQYLSVQAEQIRQRKKVPDFNSAPRSPQNIDHEPICNDKLKPKPCPPSKPKPVSSGLDENEECEYQNVHGDESASPSTTSTQASNKPVQPCGPSIGTESHIASKTFSQGDTSNVKVLELGSSRKETKSVKEPKKEKKTKEEEMREKKRKEEEKKEKKRKEEEEKRKEKERKKGKKKMDKIKEKSLPEADNYATADDTPAASYSVVRQKEIYSDPWENKPLFPPESGVVGGKPDSFASVYALPQKQAGSRKSRLEPRDIVHSENYELTLTQESGPPIIPPILNNEFDSALYDHFQSSNQSMQENVYGMASASAPISLTVEENPYEDTVSTIPYEQVG